jgi:hypothetical protein
MDQLLEKASENLDKIVVAVKNANLEQMAMWIKELGLTTFSAITKFFTFLAGELKNIVSSGLETVSGVIPVDQIPQSILTFFQNAYAAIIHVVNAVVSHLSGAVQALAADVPATITVGTITLSTLNVLLGGVLAAIVMFALYKLFKHLQANPTENIAKDFAWASNALEEMPIFAEKISKCISEAEDNKNINKVVMTILNKGKETANNVIDLLSISIDKLEGMAKILLSSKIVRVLLVICALLSVTAVTILSGSVAPAAAAPVMGAM